MIYLLTVLVPDGEPREFPLDNGVYQLGSGPDCDLIVEFGEVAPRAARLEVRGEAVFLRNLNPYSIYVGEYELKANEQTEWPAGQTVLLTRQVSLTLRHGEDIGAMTEAELAAKKSRSNMQLAIIGASILVGAMLLSNGGEAPSQATQALNFGFSELVEEITSKPPAASANSDSLRRQHRAVLNYLIDARVSDIRWGADDPRRAIAAYERLLEHPWIEQPLDTPRGVSPTSFQSTADRIRSYALARVSDLSSNLAPEE